MAKRVNVVGAKPKRVQVTGTPKRRIEPAELAADLGAEPEGEYVGSNLDLISLAELGTPLRIRLRSTGGRPALSDATEICRVPLSAEDAKALEAMTIQIERDTGTKPSPGQLVSAIARQYLRNDPDNSQVTNAIAVQQNKAEQTKDRINKLLPRLAEIASQASALQKSATDIEAAARKLTEGIGK